MNNTIICALITRIIESERNLYSRIWQKRSTKMNKAYLDVVAKTFNLRNIVVKFAARPVQMQYGTNCIFTRH